ncbi:FecR family protein [Dongia sedimenti]|uniref:FecR domain-containing protein n=1 Tax=Dongia sedimenti TaxID=3064282 RepID=A0ABU0YMU7_9PROT|nr:FecR domain-containing protein [Rhodospirillaceae bacterium R-7]
MKKIMTVAAVAAAALSLVHAGAADTMEVGALAEVRQNVYGVPPQGRETPKHRGDAVAFQETLETLEDSGALVRFIDDSKLTLGAKSKVQIDAFVFDPKKAKGNALIEISVGTLRWVTGDMPKGETVIRTPTATLTLRGTDVVVHVHPDGTTDTTVHDGKVEAHNTVTNEVTNLVPGDGATLGEGGTTRFDNDEDPDLDDGTGKRQNDDPPEHRRSDSVQTARPGPSEPAGGGYSGGDDGDDGDEGCGCL